MAVSAEVATLFLEELARRHIPVVVNESGGYVVEINGLTVTSHLDNISREFERDRDAGRIVRFVDSITQRPQVPEWSFARSRIRWQAEAIGNDFRDCFQKQVSDEVVLVLAYVSPDEGQIAWLSPGLTKSWGQTTDALWSVAAENLAALIAHSKLETTPVGEHLLGMLSTELVAFKAALVFSPHLKKIAEPTIGWPLFAVMPCRDFVYLLNQKDRDLLGRLGPVVIKEYEKGGYPLSTEVFELTDQGVRAMGAFQKSQQPEEPRGDFKTIRYRGGIVTFRIPSHWVEEYEEEGGGTFFDDVDEGGTLRLSVITFATKKPVTSTTGRDLLEKTDEPQKSAVIDLGGGNFLITYVQETEEEGEALTLYYWQIANPVPPKHMRMALFSYTVLTEMRDEERVVAERTILDAEIRRSTFAAEVGK